MTREHITDWLKDTMSTMSGAELVMFVHDLYHAVAELKEGLDAELKAWDEGEGYSEKGPESRPDNCTDILLYDEDDAAEFINAETGIDMDIIEKVINAEMKYMESIGIAYKEGE